MRQNIPYYSGNIKNSRPLGFIDVYDVCQQIKKPNQKQIDLISKIRSEKDKTVKADLKTHLTAYTPCCIPQGSRKYENIMEFTGILALDFDKLPDKEYSEQFKNYLFNEYPFIFASWLSSSAKGVRALVKIPEVCTVEEFKEHYRAMQNIMLAYDGYDRAPLNCILPMFYSIDENLLYRMNADTFKDKFTPQPQPKIKQYHSFEHDSKAHIVEKFVKSAIDKIVDNGHPQLRAISYALGGYVAGGYIDEYEAESLIHNLIESNSYLCIKSKVYQKTASEMIKKGQSEPIQMKL